MLKSALKVIVYDAKSLAVMIAIAAATFFPICAMSEAASGEISTAGNPAQNAAAAAAPDAAGSSGGSIPSAAEPSGSNPTVVTIDQNVFSMLRRFGAPGPLPFSEALACGQISVFEAVETHCNIQCKAKYCKSICDEARSGSHLPALFNVYTDECSPGVVNLFGENGLIVKITEAEYNREGGFWIRPLLEQMGQYIQPTPISIHINFVIPSTVKRIVDGKMQIIPIDWVAGDVSFGAGVQTESVNLWIAPGLKGADQLIRLSLDDSEIFMRLNGVVQGPTGL